jgi:hypothetical protein
MCHLLHCLPGEMPAKAVAFEHAKAVLAPGGILFRGVVSNLGYGPEELNAALDTAFSSHRLSIRGAVGLFVARTAPVT